MSYGKVLPAYVERSAGGTTAHKVVYTGVFTAVYYVVFFVIGMLGFFGPQFMLVSAPLTFLIEGTVIVLLLSKVRSFGALTTLGIIVGIGMVLTGHPWTVLGVIALTATAGDLVAKAGDYRSPRCTIMAFAIFQLWYIGPLLPVFYAADAFFAGIAESMGDAYADHMREIFTPQMLILLLLITFVLSLIGGWIGTKLLAGHFHKAGLV